MKTIRVSDELHKWIFDNKNLNQNSADKVIFGLIDRVEELERELELRK